MGTFALKKADTPDHENYTFVLFVIEEGTNSEQARKNLESLCEEWLPGRHEIEVVDVVDDFQVALDYNILLTPAVVIVEPEPRTTIHGDLSDTQKFVDALNLDIKENDK